MAIDIDFTRSEIRSYLSARGLNLRQQGRELRGPCPVHHGKHPNFSINPLTGLWHCYSKCGRGGSLIGLEMELSGKDFSPALEEVFLVVGRPKPNGRHKEQERLLATYDYVDEKSELLYQCVRLAPKDFRQRRPDPKGPDVNGDPKWIWDLKGVRRVLYHLPRLKDAELVLIAEGERDVHTLEGLGFTATTCPMGAGKWRSEFSDTLMGKDCVLFPDQDEPGRKHVEQVSESLQSKARSVKVIRPTWEGKDVSDWVANGATRESIDEAIRSAIPLTHAKTPSAQVNDEWGEPQGLGGELPAVLAFNVELLPESMRALVSDTAERMQTPLDFPAVVAVVSLAGVVNRRAMIQPKVLDSSWVKVPNLWGGIVGPPGILLKSPTLNIMTKPLLRIEKLWREEYDLAKDFYDALKEESKLRMSAWHDQYKTAIKKNKPLPLKPDDCVAEPVLHRLITHDATMEKLHELLRENPAGLFVIRDELSGWLASLDKFGREGEREFFLSAWNGDTPYTIDRVGRGHIHVEACCVSMLGGIQPARLRTYLNDAVQGGPLDDGLLQRFQLLIYPDVLETWTYIDRVPDQNAITNAQCIYEDLARLNSAEPLCFRFSDDAQETFVAWLTELEGKLRSPDLHPALVSHLAKYRSLMPSLALLFELSDGGRRAASLEHTQQAIAWCTYLESHCRRIYALIISPQRRAAVELARHITQGWKRGETSFTVRDIYVSDWSGLDTPERVRAALDILEDAGWVRRVESDQRTGRPSERYLFNPHLQGRAGG